MKEEPIVKNQSCVMKLKKLRVFPLFTALLFDLMKSKGLMSALILLAGFLSGTLLAPLLLPYLPGRERIAFI
ncbi:MAG: hypothetical protein GY754_38370 [bacterium]|nr:hypothetical protein [bacterium]